MREIILTFYCNQFTDPQRDVKWEADVEQIRTLVESCAPHQVIVLTDCLKEKPKEWEHVSFINIKIKHNPYFARWFAYYDYLYNNPTIDKVFMVDATDVKLQKNPFDIKQKIYVGDEKNDVVGTKWLVENSEKFSQWFKGSELRLLNPGILGGHTDMIVPLLFDIKMMYMLFGEKLGHTDMPLINFLLHTKYTEYLEHGFPLNSHFNKWEKNSEATWTHK